MTGLARSGLIRFCAAAAGILTTAEAAGAASAGEASSYEALGGPSGEGLESTWKVASLYMRCTYISGVAYYV